MVSLTFLRSVITAELGVIYEFGSERWAMLGQITALYPASRRRGGAAARAARRRLGAWDPGASEFSLDATLYDSQIGP